MSTLPIGETFKPEAERTARARIWQRGMGGHSTCHKCNNDMGGWYARAFVDWCMEGHFILEKSGGKPKLVYSHCIYPLRVIKQLIAMFFVVNGPEFRTAGDGGKNEELVWLLKNKEAKGLPPGYRFFAYYNPGSRPRMNNVGALINFNTGRDSVFSEITFPPFGYVMALDSDPPDTRLYEITYFAYSDYHDERRIYMDLPVLPTHTSYWGDYRTGEEIVIDTIKGIAAKARRQNRQPTSSEVA